jgi:hypothetical protein
MSWLDSKIDKNIWSLACRIFCTSVIETTALALSDPDGAVRA